MTTSFISKYVSAAVFQFYDGCRHYGGSKQGIAYHYLELAAAMTVSMPFSDCIKNPSSNISPVLTKQKGGKSIERELLDLHHLGSVMPGVGESSS